MQTTINRWGTGYGIRITKAISELFPVTDKQKLDVEIVGNKIIFTEAKEMRTHKRLADYLEDYGWKGESFEPEPVEWGSAAGDEVEW